MRKLLAITLLAALGGCAGMDAEECQIADWRAIGYEDGVQGRTPAAFGKLRKACAEHGITADLDAYLAGRAEGLVQFCRPQNGYRLGTRGYRYSGVCPAELEEPFVAAHADGYGLYERQAALKNIGKRLHHSRERAKQIETLLAQKTTLMITAPIEPAQRAAIAIELKQLSEERQVVEQSIHQLQYEYAVAEREFQDYRSRVAYRHGG